MADNDTVINDTGFTPEPIPDNLADVELQGLEPSEDSTETEPEEPEQEEPSENQPEPEADESDTEEEDAEEQPDTDEEPEQPQQLNSKEQARQAYEQRQERRQQRDFVTNQRQQIRQFEADMQRKTLTGEYDDIAQIKANQQLIQAQQYVDTVERNRMQAVNDVTEAKAMPFFQKNPEVLNSAINAFNDAYAVVDPDTNEYLGAEDRQGNSVSLLNYLTNEASRFEGIVGQSQRQAQASEAKMRVKAVAPSNPGKVSSSGDELQDLLDRIGDTPLV